MRTMLILAFVVVLLTVSVQQADAQSPFGDGQWWPVATDPLVPWLTPEDAAVGLATASTYWQRHYRAAMMRTEIRYSFSDEVLRSAAGSPYSGQRMRLEAVEANQAIVVLPGLETRLSLGSARARIDNAGGGFDRFGWGYTATAGFGLAPFHEGLFTRSIQPELHGEITGFGGGRNGGEIDDLLYADLRVAFLLRFELVQGEFVDSQGSWNVWFGAGLRHSTVHIDGVDFPIVTTWEWRVGTHVHLGRSAGLTVGVRFPLDFWADETIPFMFQGSFEWVFG